MDTIRRQRGKRAKDAAKSSCQDIRGHPSLTSLQPCKPELAGGAGLTSCSVWKWSIQAAMGAGASKAEKIYKAAKSNDVGALQVQPLYYRSLPLHSRTGTMVG